MNVDLAQELLNELGSSLEKLEGQHAALFQFLKDKGVIADDEFARYLAEAGNTSGVRWRAARLRLDSLISNERQKMEKGQEEERREQNRHQNNQTQAPPVQNQTEVKTKGDGLGANVAPPQSGGSKSTGAAEDAGAGPAKTA